MVKNKIKRYFTWNIHYKCNYHCTYCHAPKPKDMKAVYKSAKGWEDIWKDIYERYGETEISISGGEPFLYPDFFKIVKRISNYHVIEILTNLSVEVGDNFTEINPGRVKMGTSFHPEKTSLEDFLRKINSLQELGFKTVVNLVPWPPFLPKMKEYKKKIEAAGTLFIIQPFSGYYKGKKYPRSYAAEESKYFDDEILDSDLNRKIMNFKITRSDNPDDSPEGNMCCMGELYGNILPDGTVWRCFSPESGNIGNIIEGTFKFLPGPASCVSHRCHMEWRMVVGEEESWKDRWD